MAGPVGDEVEGVGGLTQEFEYGFHDGAVVHLAVGALIPLIPYIAGLSGITAIVCAAAVVGCALLATGGVVGVLSGQAPAPRALRQLAIGYGAAAVTYLLGLAFGTTAG